MHKHLLSLTLSFLVGCQSVETTFSSHTLAGNPRIPHKEIGMFYKRGEWESVKNRPYTAYVILRGEVERDHKITLNEVVKSYPDDSWVLKAKKFSRDAKLSPVTVGSRAPSTAEVFVVFYEFGLGFNQAIVFARQKGPLARSTSSETKYFTTWTYDN